MAITKCFYVPGSRSIIDTFDEELGLSSFGEETPEQILAKNPGVELWDLFEAGEEIARITYAEFITEPQEIDEERFIEMQEMMFPLCWWRYKDTESFKFPEAITLDLHSVFCKIGDRYFEFVNRRSLSHREIVEKCQKLL